ncbi:hypothetical protein VA599_02695 [Chromobacterium sp. TRC.1.1.SA]|uniref:Uncharacterized protein n=1 Tax=Chromobacterium indicum TaxID=3110228 RepID=A0ABV0CEM6_9NEIS
MTQDIKWELVIAVAAFIQPWAIKLFNLIFRRPKLEIYETGRIEIGHSGFGSTINLSGTLRPINKDIFVQLVELKITRLSDSAKKDFKWFAFKSGAISMTNQSPQISIASGFSIPLNAPKQYNIFFASGTFQEDINASLVPFTKKWSMIQTEYFSNLPDEARARPTPAEKTEELFGSLTKTNEAGEFFNHLNELFFWTPGDYKIELITNTTETKPVTKAWSFSISREESQGLKNNAAAIIREACGLGNTYKFIYKTYPTPDTKTSKKPSTK